MNESSRTTLYERYEHVSYALEREAFRQQTEGRKKPLKQFIPCDKALVFTAAMAGLMRDQDEVTGVVIPRAAAQPCQCHPALSEADLWKLYNQAIDEIPGIHT